MLTEVVAVVIALALGYLVIAHVPFLDQDAPSFVHSAAAGRTAHLSYADVRVTGVTTAAALVGVDGSALAPSGVFLLVSTAYRPTREPTSIGSVWLVDGDDRIYQPSEKAGCDEHPSTSTGATTYTVVCFEVPPSRLDQYRLEVARGDMISNDVRNDDVADLDLGITASHGRELAATTASYQVPTSSLEPVKLTRASVSGLS